MKRFEEERVDYRRSLSEIPFVSHAFARSHRRRGLCFWIGLCLFIIIVNAAIFLLPSSAKHAREVEIGSELQLSSWLDMNALDIHDADISRRWNG